MANASASEEFNGLINNLDDDCLMYIFSYFSIADIIQAREVCRRWNSLIRNSWKTVYCLYCSSRRWFLRQKNCYEEHELSNINDLHTILHQCGKFITSFSIHTRDLDTKSATTLMSTVIQHCKNIQDLFIEIPRSQSPLRIHSFLNNCKNLRKLRIWHLNRESEEDLSLLRTNNKQLKHLILEATLRLNDLTGKFFEYLPSDIENISISNTKLIEPGFVITALKRFNQLQSFNCYSCSWVTDPMVQIISEKRTLMNLQLSNLSVMSSTFNHLASLINLKQLDLANNDKLEDNNVMNILSNCRQLETLNLSHCCQLTNRAIISIVELETLNELMIDGLENVTDEPIGDLPSSLKRFTCGGCINIKDCGIIKLIKRASDLSKLSVYGCHGITNDLIEAAIEVTKMRDNNITLEIFVGETSVDLSELENEIPALLEINDPYIS